MVNLRTNFWVSAISGALLLIACGASEETSTPTPAVYSAPGNMAIAKTGHTTTLVSDSKVLVTGGINPDLSPLASTEMLDLVKGTWSAAGSMAVAQVAHTATLLADGKVLVVGGGNRDTGRLGTAEVYELSTGTWSAAARMSVTRVGHTATLLADGRVLVIGGNDQRETSAELYDPSTGHWSPTGSMAAREQVSHTATLLADGRILLIGSADTRGFGDSSSLVELYDPSTNIWSLATSVAPTAWGFHSATLLADGRVLVTGAVNLETTQPLPSAELYDPFTDSWSSPGSMAQARQGHTATLLSDGSVLIAGGASEVYLMLIGTLATAEIYEPSTNRWATVGSLAQQRMNHKALLLANDRVLVVGGEITTNDLYHNYCDMFAPCPYLQASAELYDPSSGAWLSQGPAPPEGPAESEEKLLEPVPPPAAAPAPTPR